MSASRQLFRHQHDPLSLGQLMHADPVWDGEATTSQNLPSFFCRTALSPYCSCLHQHRHNHEQPSQPRRNVPHSSILITSASIFLSLYKASSLSLGQSMHAGLASEAETRASSSLPLLFSARNSLNNIPVCTSAVKTIKTFAAISAPE